MQTRKPPLPRKTASIWVVVFRYQAITPDLGTVVDDIRSISLTSAVLVLQEFKDGQNPIMLATDVAARGLGVIRARVIALAGMISMHGPDRYVTSLEVLNIVHDYGDFI
jgi:hypothetical protein